MIEEGFSIPIRGARVFYCRGALIGGRTSFCCGVFKGFDLVFDGKVQHLRVSQSRSVVFEFAFAIYFTSKGKKFKERFPECEARRVFSLSLECQHDFQASGKLMISTNIVVPNRHAGRVCISAYKINRARKSRIHSS